MKRLFILVMFLLAVSIVSATSYKIEYTQVNDQIVVKESIDDVKISNYVDTEKLDKSLEGYYFVKKIVFNRSYSSVEIVLNLDIGFILEADGVYPLEYETKTDGKIISVVWSLKDVQKGENFAMFVKIKDTNKENIWVLAVVIAVIVLAFIIYKTRKKTRARKPVKKKKAKTERYEYLLDAEKKVIELLKNADRHELWQKQIQNSTGFSKAKVSRLVRNLEARGLIVKIPFGNTNKIRLK